MYHGRKVFKIKPVSAVPESDAGWAQKLIDEDRYTYADCIKYPKVMAHHVKACMRAGDKKKGGYPIINAEKGDVPPDGTAVYDALASMTTFKVHQTRPHAELPFLRAAALNEAVEHVRNEGHAPVQVHHHELCMRVRGTSISYALKYIRDEGHEPVQVRNSMSL